MPSPFGNSSQVIWEPVPPVATINVGMPDVQSKPFSPQGESGSWGFLPNCKALSQEWGLWRQCLSSSYLFCCEYFFSPLMGRSYLVSGFLSERIDPSGAIYSVCPWEDGNLGASSSTIVLIYQFTLFPKVQYFKSFN